MESGWADQAAVGDKDRSPLPRRHPVETRVVGVAVVEALEGGVAAAKEDQVQHRLRVRRHVDQGSAHAHPDRQYPLRPEKARKAAFWPEHPWVQGIQRTLIRAMLRFSRAKFVQPTVPSYCTCTCLMDSNC